MQIETPISRVWRELDSFCKRRFLQLGEPVPTRYHSTPYGVKILGAGAPAPKNFGVPKRDFFHRTLQKNENWKKRFWGVGAPPSPSLLPPKLKSTPCCGLNIVWKFQAAMTILTRYISPQSCSPLYNSACGLRVFSRNGQTLTRKSNLKPRYLGFRER